MFIPRGEIRNAERAAQMRMHGFTQRPGALAMHNPHAEDPTLPTGGEIVIQQVGDFRGLESMQVQLTGDGDRDRLIWLIGRHAGMLGLPLGQATKNPPLAGRVFDTHTLTKNTLNNQKSGFRETRGGNLLRDMSDAVPKSRQLNRDLYGDVSLGAKRLQAAVDVLLGRRIAFGLDHVSGQGERFGLRLLLRGAG